MYKDHKPFIPEGIGKCSNCPEDNIEINISFLDAPICKHCWEDEVTRCNICGEYYISDSVEFFYDEDNDLIICEYCQEDMEDEE